MATVDRFPGIARILLLHYDHRRDDMPVSEAEWFASMDPVLGAEGVYEADLARLDHWCYVMTAQNAAQLATGDAEARAAVADIYERPELFGIFTDLLEGPR